MTPLEFLREEFESVQLALSETLRYDYGPEQLSEHFFSECRDRLIALENAIAGLNETDVQKIRARITELSKLSSWISLIERSHLGEFSWPFSEGLREIATKLLDEKDLKGDPLDPIIHVIADGQGYRIVNEPQVPSASGRRRFVVVAFPRPLKHHVLLHSLFGHELGHTALFTPSTAASISKDVVPAFIATGPFKDITSLNAWLNDSNSPSEVKQILKNYKAQNSTDLNLSAETRKAWLKELICDLFGLLLFGPVFVAAHRVYLMPRYPDCSALEL